MRHALVDQPGLFLAGDHFDGEAQDGLGPRQELVAVAGLAQGLGGHGPHLLLAEPVQPLGEAGQARPAALHGLGVQQLVFIQPATLAHGFLEVFDAFDVTGVVAADFEPEAVGAQIDGRQKGTVLHGVPVGHGQQQAVPIHGSSGADCDASKPASA